MIIRHIISRQWYVSHEHQTNITWHAARNQSYGINLDLNTNLEPNSTTSMPAPLASDAIHSRLSFCSVEEIKSTLMNNTQLVFTCEINCETNVLRQRLVIVPVDLRLPARSAFTTTSSLLFHVLANLFLIYLLFLHNNNL